MCAFVSEGILIMFEVYKKGRVESWLLGSRMRICGRLFTWFRGDGISMSRLDRFLLSNKWCEKWPHCIQVAYQQGLSDNVQVMLHVDETNWGSRPLRMLKCWSEFPGYTWLHRVCP
jgi:hypothetical protein